MDKRTLRALKGSISKWEKNAAVKDPLNAKVGADYCPLCILFNSTGYLTGNCAGCPVEARTLKRYCYGTPFWEADRCRDAGDRVGFADAARAEVEFLKSLLPEASS